jgi:DsbC/DsbD-like thiol-disulfide interchange protein
MKHIYNLLFLTAIFFAAALAANAQTVTGSIGNGTFTPGKSVRATVVLSLPSGLHANSHNPGGEYAIPTTVRASGNGIKIGSVSYPRGKNRKFEFSENTINVYEGRTSFSFNVTPPANYTGKSIKVNVTVKYQACTNEVCYPPKSKQIMLTARSQ